MSSESAHHLDEADSSSSPRDEHIDPLQRASVPLCDHHTQLPVDQHYNPRYDEMTRPRLRSVGSKGSKTREPINEQIIMEDEMFEPASQRGEDTVPKVEENKNIEITKAWYNLWGLSEYGSQTLENKASVARDHMANERTFLSWMRTSLGLATAGVGVTQLFKIADTEQNDNFLIKVGKPIGATFICIAVLCIVMGMMRFFKTQTLLQEDRYPAAKVSVSILVFLIFSVCVVTLVAVLHSS